MRISARPGLPPLGVPTATPDWALTPALPKFVMREAAPARSRTYKPTKALVTISVELFSRRRLFTLIRLTCCDGTSNLREVVELRCSSSIRGPESFSGWSHAHSDSIFAVHPWRGLCLFS